MIAEKIEIASFSCLPDAMRAAPRWLVWKAEPHADPSKKPRKIPYYAAGTRRQGVLDTPADRAKLASFEAAMAALRTGRYTGIGFALGDDGAGNYWQGIDLDGTDQRPELAALVERLPGYVERSPSGHGWHAVGIGRDIAPLGSNDSGIEAYSHGRYFTVTGDAGRGEIECIADFIETTLAPLHSGKPVRTSKATAARVDASSFFAKVNTKALASLSSWVPSIFPKATAYHDGYRVSSSDLGRDLEEDLSIVPAGARDFGEEAGKTPIDLVIEWGPATDATSAALLLCDLIGISPNALGWGAKTEPVPVAKPVAAQAKPVAAPDDAPEAEAEAGQQELLDLFRGTDDGNADLLLSRHGADIRYCPAWEKWLTWSGTCWRTDARLDIERISATVPAMVRTEASRVTAQCAELLARIAQMRTQSPLPRDYQRAMQKQVQLEERGEYLTKLARTLESTTRRASMLTAARHRVVVEHTELDGKPLLLNCANGTIDLRTGELRQHNRGDLLAHDIGITYDPAATAPTWTAFLNSTFGGDAELIEFVQRAFGYSLTGDVREQVLLICHGVGSNGKSVFLNILRKLLGTLAWQAAPDLLMSDDKSRHPTEQADLFGRRAVICQETGEGRRFNETLIKQLTGGDAVTARRMREDFWSFNPTHKLWLSTNHKPEIRGTDHAIWRRIRLIPFSVKFTDDGPARKDPEMESKLLAELPGILAWAVAGCRAWLRDGLRAPEAVMAATHGYQQEMDVFAAWMADCAVVGKRCEASAANLYASYSAWAERTGERVEKQRKFGQRLKERGFEQFTNNGAWWRGIGLAVSDADGTNGRNGTDFAYKRTLNNDDFPRAIHKVGSVPSVPSVKPKSGEKVADSEQCDAIKDHHTCGSCAHAVRAADSSVESWRTCAAGKHGGWPDAQTWCEAWTAGPVSAAPAVQAAEAAP